jgi:hypothetical protein
MTCTGGNPRCGPRGARTENENDLHPVSPIQPPLNYDDLIDLHYLLEADDLFLQLMAADIQGREAA